MNDNIKKFMEFDIKDQKEENNKNKINKDNNLEILQKRNNTSKNIKIEKITYQKDDNISLFKKKLKNEIVQRSDIKNKSFINENQNNKIKVINQNQYGHVTSKMEYKDKQVSSVQIRRSKDVVYLSKKEYVIIFNI